MPLSNGWVRLLPNESRVDLLLAAPARGAPPWLQRLLTGRGRSSSAAHDPDCVAVTYAWNPQLSGATWELSIGIVGLAQRGQVDALQRSDPKRGPGGQLPVRDIEPNWALVGRPR